jgi:hypothetical protein
MLLLEEFFRQGDKERELGLPFSPLCDRNNTLVAESQIGMFSSNSPFLVFDTIFCHPFNLFPTFSSVSRLVFLDVMPCSLVDECQPFVEESAASFFMVGDGSHRFL